MREPQTLHTKPCEVAAKLQSAPDGSLEDQNRMGRGFGFRVSGLGFRVEGSGFRV